MRKIIFLALLPLIFASPYAMAEVQPDGLLDEVATRFQDASSAWAGVITTAATWLYWTLVVISMVWTFGIMALRRADIGEFFAEFFRFTMFTGFFWWLLTNGPNFANSIIVSLRKIATDASGLPHDLTPSTPVSIGWDILVKSAKTLSFVNPIDGLAIFLITSAILACMATVAANMLQSLINAWVLSYAGVFVLGFGGSRWTSDIALNYYRTILGVALKLMTMTLLAGIAISIMYDFYDALSEDASVRELLLVFVVSLVLAILIHSVPNSVASLVPGGGANGIGSTSAGAMAGAAMSAGGMAWSAGKSIANAAMGAAANISGGVSAISAAFRNAQSNMDGEQMRSFSAGGDSSGDSSGGSAYAQAAGYADSGASGADSVSNASGAEGNSSTSGAEGNSSTSGADGNSSTSGADGADSGGNAKGDAAANTNGSGGDAMENGRNAHKGGAAAVASLAMGTASELAKGIGGLAMEKTGKIKNGFMERADQTLGGQIAATIRANRKPSFEGNTLEGDSDVDVESEVAAFVRKNNDTQ